MKRTRFYRKPTAILTSDWHLREDTPTCWIGDFQMEQWSAVGKVSQLQEEYKCPVIHAGDLFHHWKPSPWLISKAIEYLPEHFSTICGQHDLPQHNLELLEKSGLFTLLKAGKISLISGVHFGMSVPQITKFILNDRKVLVWHHLTYLSKPFPGAEGGMAQGILMKYPQFDLIVTGDNHQSFSIEHEGRLLVNPGNITRQTADQEDFQPRVALWYAEDNTITWVNLPRQEGVITREHISVKEERNARIDAFISKLDKDYEIGLSFEENLKQFFHANQVKESVKQIIYKAIE
jgi:DNA repair exonuclease SbcCD nuclease subunit